MPRALVRLAAVVFSTVLVSASVSGCLDLSFLIGDEDECGGRSTEDSLRISLGIKKINSQGVTLRASCEASDRDWPIDRYLFIHELPEAMRAEHHFEPQDLSPEQNGSVTRTISAVSGDSAFVVRYEGWGDTAGRLEPTISLRWDRDTDGSPDEIPGGWYNVTIALNNEPSQRLPFSHCWCPGGPH